MDLLALAARIERMTGGSSDDEITERRAVNDIIHAMMPEPKVICPLDYCASLDAAMTLIDGEVFFHVSRFSPGEGGASAHVYPNRGLGDDYEGNAATPALALCAAALKSRARTLKQGEE